MVRVAVAEVVVEVGDMEEVEADMEAAEIATEMAGAAVQDLTDMAPVVSGLVRTESVF